jgi:hypothetical protein
MEAKWLQSPVLPWTRLAYDACLNAGSTAVVPKLASLTGFAPVISCLRGRRVGWTTPQGQKWYARPVTLQNPALI